MISDREQTLDAANSTMKIRAHSPVIHIVELLAPGGIETLVLDLLRSGSPDDAVFSLSGSKEELVARWAALQPYAGQIEAFARPPKVDPFLALRIARRLRARNPGAVVLHHIGPLLYGGLAARLAGIRRLVHVEHDCWHYTQPRRRALIAAASRIFRPQHVAVSRQVADALGPIVPHARVSVIHPGVDLSRYVPRDKKSARQPIDVGSDVKVIGVVARLVPEKGLAHLIHALVQLPGDVHLVIAGDGPERPMLEKTAESLRIAGRVHFLGHRDDVAQLYPAFDVFCLPSLSEGLPRSVLEAQACGVPVVATNVGALSDAVCHRTGLLVEPGDPDALADALAIALARPQLMLSPRDYLRSRLSWSSTVAGFRAITAGA